MIIEKTNIKAFAKCAFTFTTILMIIYLSVSVFGIIIVEEDVHFLRTMLTISCLFVGLVYYLLIKHYCFQTIYKMEINHDEVTLSSLNKEYKFQLGKNIKIHDTNGRFILRIGKEKLIVYKFMLGKKSIY